MKFRRAPQTPKSRFRAICTTQSLPYSGQKRRFRMKTIAEMHANNAKNQRNNGSNRAKITSSQAQFFGLDTALLRIDFIAVFPCAPRSAALPV